MIKLSKAKIGIVGIGLTLIVLVTLGLFIRHSPATPTYEDKAVTNYHRPRVEKATRQLLEPLKASLTAMGFKDLDRLETTCGYTTQHSEPGDDVLRADGTYFNCSASVDRFLRLPTTTAGRNEFLGHARELDAALHFDGWHIGDNMAWFEKVTQKGNFLPNQLSVRSIEPYSCGINFWTAYSDPDPPAISVNVYCGIDFTVSQ